MDAMNGVRLGLLAMVAAVPAWGCDSSCIAHADVRTSFTIEIDFEGKPLAGADVKISGRFKHSNSNWTFITGANGKAVVRLPAGDYDLTARKLGMLVYSECALRVSRIRGKRELRYTFGEKAWPVARMSGRLTEWQWESYLKRVIRAPDKKEVPFVPPALTLYEFDGKSRRMRIADDGSFDFGEMPDGLYVLQVEAQNFLPRLFRLESGAKHADLKLIAEDVICGGHALFFRDEVKE